MSRDRTQEIRDEMLIDMARGIQVLLGGIDNNRSLAATVIGRLEAHIGMLKETK